MMAFASTPHIHFDEEVHNTSLCMHPLESDGHLIAFAGGVGGQMVKV